MKSSEFIRETTVEKDKPVDLERYCPGTAADVALADELNACTFGEAMSIEDAIAMAGIQERMWRQSQ